MTDRNRDSRSDFDAERNRFGDEYERVEYVDRWPGGADRLQERPGPRRPIDAWRHEPVSNQDLAENRWSRLDSAYRGALSPYARYPYGITGTDWSHGRFVGRGPKGYRRSDERIREDVSDRLMIHPDVDASDVEVRVANSIVTLTGTVEDRHEKRLVEHLTEACLGVEDVNNQLKVRHGFWASLTGERATERELHRPPDREDITKVESDVLTDR